MSTASLDYGLDVESTSNQARTDIVAFGTAPILKYAPFAAMGDVVRYLQIVTLVTALTGPITHVDQLRRASQQDELSSVTSMAQFQTKQRISLREARQRALKVLADTERELHEERIAEGHFLASLWDDEGRSV